MRPLIILVVALLAFLAGHFVFGSTLQRFARESYLLISNKLPNGATGPFAVASASIELVSDEPQERTITAHLWYPTAGDKPDEAPGAASQPPAQPCEKILPSLHLAEAPKPFSLLLYAPGMGGNRLENRMTSQFLASNGYLVLAMDDGIVPQKPGDQPSAFPLDFRTIDLVRTTIRLGTEKALHDARAALQALDRFTHCAQQTWAGRVIFDRVGFFGFSLGGSTAAEAALLDPRVVASVNLDGWLFGPSADGKNEKPYLLLLTDDTNLTSAGLRKALASDEPAVHYEAILNAHFVQTHKALVQRPGNYGFWIHGTGHGGFTDLNLSRSQWRVWRHGDPFRIQESKDAYLKAFFDTALKGMAPAPLLMANPSPYARTDVLKDNAEWGEGIATAPTQSDLASK